MILRTNEIKSVKAERAALLQQRVLDPSGSIRHQLRDQPLPITESVLRNECRRYDTT